MKIRLREKFKPINLIPGDKISLIYRDEDGKETVLLTDDFDRAISVDTGIIFDLEQNELDWMNLNDGIGAIFGESK